MEEERSDALEVATQAHEKRKAPPLEEVTSSQFFSFIHVPIVALS
jgi:hypothetical protein